MKIEGYLSVLFSLVNVSGIDCACSDPMILTIMVLGQIIVQTG